MRQIHEGLFVLLFIALVAFSVGLGYYFGDLFALSESIFIILSLIFIIIIPPTTMYLFYKVFNKFMIDLTSKNYSFKVKLLYSLMALVVSTIIVVISIYVFLENVIL